MKHDLTGPRAVTIRMYPTEDRFPFDFNIGMEDNWWLTEEELGLQYLFLNSEGKNEHVHAEDEDATITRWYRCPNTDVANVQLIASGNNIDRYILTNDDVGYYMVASVEVVTKAGVHGPEVFSDFSDKKVRLRPSDTPECFNVFISGTPMVNRVMTLDYRYKDLSLSEEQWKTNKTPHTEIKWYLADDAVGTNATQINGETTKDYLPTTDIIGKYVAVSVTPANKLDRVGNEYFSEYIGVGMAETTEFITRWSNVSSVTLPLTPSGTYNFIVDWGDGNSDTITTWDAASKSHVYSSNGTYDISITGVLTHWSFRTGAHGDYSSHDGITEVVQWGNIPFRELSFQNCNNITSLSFDDFNGADFTNFGYGIYGMSSLTHFYSENLNTSRISNFSYFARNASKLEVVKSSRWAFSSVLNIANMFVQNSELIELDTSKWNVYKAEVAYNAFTHLAKLEYIDTRDWITHKIPINDRHNPTFGGAFSNNPLLKGHFPSKNWWYNFYFPEEYIKNTFLGSPSLVNYNEIPVKCGGAYHPETFEMEVLISESGTVFTLPAYSSSNDFVINWGDGSDTESVTGVNPSHTYMLIGRFTITIKGTMPAFGFKGGFGVEKVIKINQVGDVGLTQVEGFVQGAVRLMYANISSLPNSITDLSYFFDGCAYLNTVDTGNLIFDNVVNFRNFVSGCHSLVSMDTSLWVLSSNPVMTEFAKNASLFTTSLNSTAFWGNVGIVTYTDAFTNCNGNLNWANVPESWGGEAGAINPTYPNGVYTVPYGRSNADGTAGNPYGVKDILEDNVLAGSNVFFRRGYYINESFDFKIGGTSGSTIHMQAYNNEQVIFVLWQSNIVLGDFIELKDVIVTYPENLKSVKYAWDDPLVPIDGGFAVLKGEESAIVNCILYDSTGLHSPVSSVNPLVYGNILFYGGTHDGTVNQSNYGREHGMYFENGVGSRMQVYDNVIMHFFGNGIQYYSDGGAQVYGSDFYNNLIINSGSINSKEGVASMYQYLLDCGGASIEDSNVVDNCHGYMFRSNTGTVFQLGYHYNGYTHIMRDCTSTNGGVQLQMAANCDVQRNTFTIRPTYYRGHYGYGAPDFVILNPVDTPDTYFFDHNNYYDWASKTSGFHVQGVENGYWGNFEGWQTEEGHDLHSAYASYSDFTLMPDSIHLYPNAHEGKRCNVFIHNNSLSASVPVDISSVFSNGDTYYVYDLENLEAPIMEGVYNNSNINISTNQIKSFPYIRSKHVAEEATHTGDDFGAFLIIGRKLELLPENSEVNNNPIARNDTSSVDKGGSVVLNIVSNDEVVAEGASLDVNSIVITEVVAGSVVDNGNGTVTFTQDGSAVSLGGFFYTIEDSLGNVSNKAYVSITVNPDIPDDIISSDQELTDYINTGGTPGDVKYLSGTFTQTHNISIDGTGENTISFLAYASAPPVMQGKTIISGSYIVMDNITFEDEVELHGFVTISNCNFNANAGNFIYNLVFPANDWRGYYLQIDSNTYNVRPDTKFTGVAWQENWSGYNARFPKFDNNSIFQILP